MNNILANFIIRQVKKTIRRRDFWFAITVYPLLLGVYRFINNDPKIYAEIQKFGNWYFLIAFLGSAYIVFLVVFETIEKRFRHKIQGDKLKIKQEQNWR